MYSATTFSTSFESFTGTGGFEGSAASAKIDSVSGVAAIGIGRGNNGAAVVIVGKLGGMESVWADSGFTANARIAAQTQYIKCFALNAVHRFVADSTRFLHGEILVLSVARCIELIESRGYSDYDGILYILAPLLSEGSGKFF